MILVWLCIANLLNLYSICDFWNKVLFDFYRIFIEKKGMIRLEAVLLLAV